jgi:peptidoglycan/LPS O-acetylase OafA/YrhL
MTRSSSGNSLKLAALVVLAAPVGLLVMVVIGNVASNDPRTLGHATLTLPLLLAMALLWRRPRLVGIALVVGGLIAMAVYPFDHSWVPWRDRLFIEIVIFAPLPLTGLLLWLAARTEARDPSD